MPNLYDFILKRLEFYEKKYPGQCDDINYLDSRSRSDLERQISRNGSLLLISQLLDEKDTKAIDQTPVVSCDTIHKVNICNKHDTPNNPHSLYPCGFTGNKISVTVFEESEMKLLYIEIFNEQNYNYRCFFVFDSPSAHIYYSLWAYRIFNGEMLRGMRKKYICDEMVGEYHLPERFYFPKMRELLEEHKLAHIKHGFTDEHEKTWAPATTK